MNNSIYSVPFPKNEPVYSYAPGTPERALLEQELDRQIAEPIVIPLIINGQEVYTDTRVKVVAPHNHSHVLAECCMAGEKELKAAVDAALAAKEEWERMPWYHRLAIFNRMAMLISGKYRYKLNAATMLGQSKVAYQAEIDTPCELCDFLRFNVYHACDIYSQQPISEAGVWNRFVYRPLEGFVLAVTPFNFTAIAGNLPTAPAMMGNTVVWKPSTTAVLSNYYLMQVFKEAGLPDGVINFVPSRGADVSAHVVSHPLLAGFHFTGSTDVFRSVWKQIGMNIENYRSYPRLVGETGGKDFLVAHPTAEIDPLISAIVRGAFEFQGQKCSALSRCYIPQSLWPEVKARLLEETAKLKWGDVRDLHNFMGAVIDKASFDQLVETIETVKAAPDAELLCGGYATPEENGWFIYPTIIEAKDKDFFTMRKELFGPVLTVYVYEDAELDAILEHCDRSTEYALTGSIFAQDRAAVADMEWKLRNAAGNFYINDKPTGAMVGHQPFGGARGSGTNDKAGSALNLYRWVSICTVKDNFVPPAEIDYPFMR